MARTVFAGGHLFDGTGAAPARADVAIEDGLIVDVGVGLDGDQSVDLSGRTLLPGLFDCHVHVMLSHLDTLRGLEEPFSYQFYAAARNLGVTLAAGITSVRDAGGADLGVKQALEDGLIVGPRLQLSITMLSQTGGHGDGWHASGATVDLFPPHPGRPSAIVDGPDEMRRRVRELVRAGADVIKVATTGGVLSPRDKPTQSQFGDDELAVLVGEANAAGIPVMAHAQGANGIKAALRAGVRSIEHGIYLDDEAIALLLERGAFLVPTLVAPLGVIEAAEAGAAIPEPQVRKAREVVEAHRDSVRRAIRAGVRVALGTDAPISPHGANLRELEQLVAVGMTPGQALVAATGAAADLCGVADWLGTVEVGKRADLVVVRGDPLDVHDYAARVESVWKDGRCVVGRPVAG
jgi:imidazolonepropionase-like amidohydrolase